MSWLEFSCAFNLVCRWEKYQSEEEAALGRGKRQRKAVSYREAYAPHPVEAVTEVICFVSASSRIHFLLSFINSN